ncbi:MAG: UDP-N-acetylmuramate dehydrogenase [Patescibacteria group bacterium]|nr:UDP-N-acetylmuramate dehydrogenase [Patescibacteria group bacterium]
MISNELLSKHTTFKIGGPAKYFIEAKSADDIVDAVKFSKKFFILGGGSNLLVSDKGFDGLVIKIVGGKINFDGNLVEADVGVALGYLIAESVKRGLAGLELLAGIPGTLGGAIFGNVGLGKDGSCIGDVVESVRLLMPDGKIKKVKKEWMKFSYRQSHLKNFKLEKRPIILSATLKLKKGDKEELGEIIKEKIELRKEIYPTEPCAGCVFKNPSNQSAASMIDDCGLKGERVGGAQVSKKHANFIVNTGKAKSKDVIKLISLIKKKVKNKFKITLEEEIQLI